MAQDEEWTNAETYSAYLAITEDGDRYRAARRVARGVGRGQLAEELRTLAGRVSGRVNWAEIAEVIADGLLVE